MKANIIKNIIRFISYGMLLILTLSPNATALNEATHKAINNYIVDENSVIYGSYLHNYLKNNLGMQDGVKSMFNSKMAKEWIGYGGVEEDSEARSLNHFLNPITNKGLSLNYSALEWATLTAGKQTFSWDDVRSYYYNALTSTDKTTRELNFAKTFKGVGQIMHLVQDMSVPPHTRGDKHPSFWFIGGDDYELWFLKPKVPPLSSYSINYFTTTATTFFLIPQLFDTGQYDGTNPSITTSSNSIGLAEYTNANFLSSDTIFKDFAYPDWSNLQEYDEDIAPGKTAVYQRKLVGGENVEHFVRGKIYYDKLPSSDAFRGLRLDDNVHKDYAKILIPRAIGYSSQVLKYFFRGQMKVLNMPVFDDQNNTLKELYVKVRNTTPTKETMVGNNDSSCFSLSWHYTPAGSDSDTYGSYPYCVYLDKPLPYGLDTNGNDIDDNTYTTTIIFNRLDQIPNVPAISKTDYPSVEFTLTYLGTLGDEKMPPSNVPGQVTIAGAVIGKVFKPAKSILFDEAWLTAPKGDNLVWSISSDRSGNAVDTTFINNFFYCPDTQQYTSYGCPSGCPSPFTDPQGQSTDTIVTANGGTLLMTNTANVIPGCDPSSNNRPGQGNVVKIGSDIWHYNCQGQYVTSGNTYNPVDSANQFIFPIKITKNSYVQFSLDDMSISPAPPASNYALAYQILEFQFNHGYVLQFSAGNQTIYNSNPYVGYFSFDLGYIIVGNIYGLFAKWGFPPPPADFQLMSINITQQALWNLPCNETYTQKISVDNIRVGELNSRE